MDIEIILEKLKKIHSNPVCELEYDNPFHLLIAVILSAQCTDKRVNKVTPALFEKWQTPEQFASLTAEELIPYIKSCGYYNSKSKSIIEAAKSIVTDFNGIVPQTVEELMTLRGVGKKTANVVYAVAFGGDAIAVDTHVRRVSNRLGLSNSNDVLKIEKDLNNLFPQTEWSTLHHLLIHHGRYVCMSRNPKCNECILNSECKYFNSNKK
mgnify:FL=1